MTEANHVGKFGFSKRYGPRFQLIIIDEADSLEDEVMRYVEFSLSPSLVKRLRIPEPERKTVAEVWPAWATDHALPILTKETERLERDLTVSMRDNHSEPDTRLMREYRHISGLATRLTEIGPQLAENWVYCVDSETEILTSNKGWISYTDLRVGDLALAIDPASKKIQWEPVEKVHSFPRSEERRVGKECRSRWSPYH